MTHWMPDKIGPERWLVRVELTGSTFEDNLLGDIDPNQFDRQELFYDRNNDIEYDVLASSPSVIKQTDTGFEVEPVTIDLESIRPDDVDDPARSAVVRAVGPDVDHPILSIDLDTELDLGHGEYAYIAGHEVSSVWHLQIDPPWPNRRLSLCTTEHPKP